MRKICILPNDPLYKYYEKGEIKARYYNAGNFFDEVHLVTLADREIEPEKVQTLGGDARLFIHPIGGLKSFAPLTYRSRVLRLVQEIRPDLVKVHGDNVPAYLGVFAAKRLGIPIIASIHHNNDEDMRDMIRQRITPPTLNNVIRYFVVARFTEPYVLRGATKVICVYQAPAIYARRHGAKNVEVIYNRVYASQYPERDFSRTRQRLRVICIGRLAPEKNQEVLVRAVAGLDVDLVLIGDGPLRGRLEQVVAELGLQEQVAFIKSVPNAEIHNYYMDSDIFAIPIIWGGVCIPVREAMAASLPLVVPKPRWEPEPELVGDLAIVVDNTPEGFRQGLRKLIADPDLRRELGLKGRQRALEMDGEIMEGREMEIYKELLAG